MGIKVYAVRVGDKFGPEVEDYLKSKLDITFINKPKEDFKLQWNKIHFFNLNVKGPICVIDIDIELLNDYHKIFEYPIKRGEFLSMRSWWETDPRACELNGGFYKFYPEDTKVLYNLFKNDKRFWERYFIDVKKVKIGPVAGEENFVDFAVRKFGLDLKFIPDEWTSRWVKNPNKEWLSKINKKYPGKYLKLDKFNDNVKLLHYTMND